MLELRNHSLIKQINRARILNAIRLWSPIARTRIAEKTGLDKKSITNFMTELLKEGLVEEFGKQGNAAGRPFTMLRFGDRHVIGIYIAPYFVSGIRIDLYGRIVQSANAEFPLYSGPKAIADAARHVYLELKASGAAVLGTGVCIPGFLDLKNGILLESVNIPGLKGTDCKKLFAEFIEAPMFFEEASRGRALAEKWFGKGRDYNDFVCMDVAVGIGTGIVNDRRLYKGAGEYAGEIGHVIIHPGGKVCRCGNAGCLEAYASEHVVLERLNRLLDNPVERLAALTPADAARLEESGLIASIGDEIGRGLATVVNLLCPKVIILSGPVVKAFADRILPSIRSGMKQCCLRGSFENTNLMISELEYGEALGAASLPLAGLFEVPGYYYV